MCRLHPSNERSRSMKLLSTIAALVMLTGTAMAADLDVKPRPRSAPPPQQYSEAPQYPQFPQYPQQQYQPQYQPRYAVGAPTCPRLVRPPCLGGCPPQFTGYGSPLGYGGFPPFGFGRGFGHGFRHIALSGGGGGGLGLGIGLAASLLGGGGGF
jgi:hypothetical protein